MDLHKNAAKMSARQCNREVGGPLGSQWAVLRGVAVAGEGFAKHEVEGSLNVWPLEERVPRMNKLR